MIENKNLVYILGAVVVILLVAVVALVYVNTNRVPGVEVTTGGQTQTGGTTTGGGSTPVTFDPSTATKVPAGVTPEEYVKGYYEDIDAGRYAEAYKRLPLDKQQSYGDPGSFEQQLKSYGISGYEMEKAQSAGDEVSIVAWQQTPNGAFGYKWVLLKEGDGWLVKSRVQAGMK